MIASFRSGLLAVALSSLAIACGGGESNTAGAAGNVTITKVGASITVTGMVGGLDAVSLC